MKAVIYCRVSTAEQTQNLSLPTQEQACREYCARNGYDVDHVFVDAGESAKTIDRPQFREMLAHCRRRRGQVHAVIVYSLTRFSRNSTDHHAIASLLRGLGIVLRSVTEPIDDSPSGRLMESIMAAIGQFDNDAKAERVRAGLRAAVDRGRWCWPAPLGYLNADTKRGGPSLVPDPDRAPAVREAFELYAAGVRGRELRMRLASLGLTSTKTSRQPISRNGLNKLLRQRAYIGIIQPRGWDLERRGDFEPLVTEDLFARVQLELARPERRGPRRHVNHPDFPLRRFVRCSCGRSLTGSWSKGRGARYAFYACPNGCHRYRKTALEDAFLRLLDTLRPQPAAWRLFQAALLDAWRDRHRQAADARTGAEKRLAAIKERRAKLDDAYLYRSAIDEETYRAQRDRLREELTLAEMALTDATVHELDVEGLLAFAEHALTHASALWTAAADAEARIRLQWTFFPAGLTLRASAIGTARARRQAAQSQHLQPRADREAEKSEQAAIRELEPFADPVNCLRFFELGPVDDPTSGQNEDLVLHRAATWNRAAAFLQTFSRLRTAA